jgi:hypothetical protein
MAISGYPQYGSNVSDLCPQPLKQVGVKKHPMPRKFVHLLP